MISSKMKTLTFLLMFIGMLTVTGLSVNTSHASMNQTGSLEVSSSSILADSTVVVTAKSLTVSTAYAIYRDSTAIANFTTSGSETEKTFYVNVPAPATGTVVIIYLYSVASTVDTFTVVVNNISTFIPTNLIITAAISILIIVLIATILRSIGGSR